MKSIVRLLNDVESMVANKKDSFTFLDAIGQSSREMTHSSFIANLLNPFGKHALGDTFSKEFINFLKEKYPQLMKEYNTPITHVEVEKSFGPERVKDGQAFGGRADIYLEDEQGHVIVIENKIFAGDQERQLERYWNSIGKNGIVIYLTLNGKNPSLTSLGNAKDIKLINLSYSNLVKCFEDCIQNINNPELETIVNQYINKIKELIMDSKVQTEILKSAKNMRAALAIQDNATAARESATMAFMETLSTALQGGPVSKQNTFWLFKYGKFEICIEWNLYIRTKDAELKNKCDSTWKESDHPEKRDDIRWKYITLNNSKLNFHTFEGEAGRWLDEPEKLISDVKDKIGKIIKLSFPELSSPESKPEYMENMITSGIARFDHAINGFRSGQLIVIGGRPAMGKTRFVLTLAKGLAIDNGIPVAIFSLELPSLNIKRRIIEIIEGNDKNDIELSDKALCLDRYPICIDDNPRLNISELKAQIKAFKNKFGIKVVIIDHILLIDGCFEDSVKTISELKRIAVDLEVSIVATSSSQMPILDDLQTSLSTKNDNLLWKIDPAAMNYIDVCAIIYRCGFYSIFNKEDNNDTELYFIKNDNLESPNRISFKDCSYRD